MVLGIRPSYTAAVQRPLPEPAHDFGHNYETNYHHMLNDDVHVRLPLGFTTLDQDKWRGSCLLYAFTGLIKA